jgi:hypothetical protein
MWSSGSTGRGERRWGRGTRGGGGAGKGPQKQATPVSGEGCNLVLPMWEHFVRMRMCSVWEQEPQPVKATWPCVWSLIPSVRHAMMRATIMFPSCGLLAHARAGEQCWLRQQVAGPRCWHRYTVHINSRPCAYTRWLLNAHINTTGPAAGWLVFGHSLEI